MSSMIGLRGLSGLKDLVDHGGPESAQRLAPIADILWNLNVVVYKCVKKTL